MNAQFNWLQCGDEDTAHYCCVNETKAAAVCGYASWLKWHRPDRQLVACEVCERIAKSAEPIVFKMPDGKIVEVRGRQ